MASFHESFWQHDRFAVVGHNAKKPFPVLTYRALRKLGKTVFPVDPEAEQIEGDDAFADLEALPEEVEAVVLEVPKQETAAWVEKIADRGIKDVWIHMNRDTPEALAIAKERGLEVRTGTCAVMYVTPQFSGHSIHKWLRKLSGNY